ncbi:MAG: CheR family methyltransferase [Candidatus Kryptoniota bacterium]
MTLFNQFDPMSSGAVIMTDDYFSKLRKFIYEHTGIFYADNKKYLLESRISRRLAALRMPGFAEYLSYLNNGGASDELTHLVNSITINETFFFRNEPQLKALENSIIPAIIKKRTGDPGLKVKIWSAACSTGEEPYTIAMIIHDKFMAHHPSVNFEIIGTDINTAVIETARRGIYRDYSVKNVPMYYQQKYFTRDGERYILSEDILEMVQFRSLNLFDSQAMKEMAGFDIIIAANVLIYFDINSKQRVVTSLYDSLNSGGFLLLGFSETLYGISQAFKPVHFDRTIAYGKE